MEEQKRSGGRVGLTGVGVAAAVAGRRMIATLRSRRTKRTCRSWESVCTFCRSKEASADFGARSRDVRRRSVAPRPGERANERRHELTRGDPNQQAPAAFIHATNYHVLLSESFKSKLFLRCVTHLSLKRIAWTMREH
ncbi:uncharacterized protein LOC143025586 isoform X1 [Oratosquilla oratoria]|uniref:uncharacterized protein LOC143025586 isoform X1 n=1 Tax=Oratosquilla oratoria TaxID=337810 RepID=UPI003F76A97E